MRAAVGDYVDEAAVLLLLNLGHWLPQLASADLITLMSETDGEALWAEVARPDFEQQRLAGGSCGPPRASPTGIPVDLGDLGGGLDRRALILVLAAMAHAAGSHNHRAIAYDPDGIPRLGDPMPLLVAWPLRD